MKFLLNKEEEGEEVGGEEEEEDGSKYVAGFGDDDAHGFSVMASLFQTGCWRVVSTEMHWWRLEI